MRMVGPGLRRASDGRIRGAPFFIGPELLGGGFVQLGAGDGTHSTAAVTRGMLGGGLDLAVAVTPFLTLDARLGNVRCVPGGSGALLFVGADIGATVHF